jgi:parvulin-like peptidyl-prolyl isomerase
LVLFLPENRNLDAEVTNKIVAVVNGEVITSAELKAREGFLKNKKDFSKRNENNLKKVALEDLIENELILSYAKRKKISVDRNLILRRIEELKSKFSSELDFLKYLEENGLSYNLLYNNYLNGILRNKVIDTQVRQKIEIHPDELLKYYQANKDRFKIPMKIRAKKIFLKEQDNIQDKLNGIMHLLKKGTNFDELAKNYSASKEIYFGKNGWIEKGFLKEDLEKELFSLKVSSISKPVKVGDGYYIFKIVDKKAPSFKKFEDVKGYIYEILFRKKFEKKFHEFIDNLKASAQIEIKI